MPNIKKEQDGCSINLAVEYGVQKLGAAARTERLLRVAMLIRAALQVLKRNVTTVSIYAFDYDGLRVSELDFVTELPSSTAGESFERDQLPDVILAIEDYYRCYDVAPTRPKGWESCLNIANESAWRLLKRIFDPDDELRPELVALVNQLHPDIEE